MFEIETELLEDNVVILEATGAMVMPDTIKFRQAVREQIRQDRKRIAVDCSGITKMDVAGYAEIVSCWSTVTREGGKLFCAPGGQFKAWDDRTAFSMFHLVFRHSLDHALRDLRRSHGNGRA